MRTQTCSSLQRCPHTHATHLLSSSLALLLNKSSGSTKHIEWLLDLDAVAVAVAVAVKDRISSLQLLSTNPLVVQREYAYIRGAEEHRARVRYVHGE